MKRKDKKRWIPQKLLAPLFLAALCWAPPSPAFSSPEGPETNGTNSAGALSRLIEISTRLEQLNGTLRNELADSRKNSAALSATLESSRIELDGLRLELEALRSESTLLARSAESSRQESEELRKALTKADSSLRSLELSFEAYRKTAQGELGRLERSRSRWKIAAFAAGALALGGWAAFAAAAP